MQKVAVYTGNQAVYDDMEICAKSLISHSDVDTVYFLIEDDKFYKPLPDCIKVKNVSKQRYFKFDGPNMSSRFTYFAMMRAALAFEFPELTRILSLDCDTICIKNISDIWNLPIDDYYFAASREKHRSGCGITYTNVGVALMNLDKLRDGKAQECIDVLNRQKFIYLDQDVMNFLCAGRVYNMNSIYNSNNWTEPTNDPRIVHYAGIPKWQWRRDSELAKKYENMSWNEVFSLREYVLKYQSD